MFDGDPARRLPPLITARHYDMLVLAVGPHDDAAAAVGSLAGKLADATAGDVVLVKGGRAARDAQREVARSVRQQAAHDRQQFV